MSEPTAMPPCGCRSSCMHRDHPGQVEQRECRAGVRAVRAELVTPVADVVDAALAQAIDRFNARNVPTPEQRARTRWGAWRHLRTRARPEDGQ